MRHYYPLSQAMKWIALPESSSFCFGKKRQHKFCERKRNGEREKMRNVLLNGRWALEDIRRRMRKFAFRRRVDCFFPLDLRFEIGGFTHSPNSSRCFKQSKWNWSRRKNKVRRVRVNKVSIHFWGFNFSGQISSTTFSTSTLLRSIRFYR